MIFNFAPLSSVFLWTLCLGISPSLHAELPELDEKEWLGSFAGQENSKLRFTISSAGNLLVEPIFKGDTRAYVKMPITFGLELTAPNGRKRVLEILPDSLESPDEPTTDFERTVIRGRCEGDAEVEVTIELKRGELSIGGQVTKPGSYNPESLQAHVSAHILNFYGHKKIKLKDDPEAFEALISDDFAKLKWTNGKQHKLDFIEPREMASEEINGPGVSKAEVSIKSINHRFLFEATGDSTITMSNRKGSGLHAGMFVNWSPIAGKDSQGKARFVLSVK